MQKLLEKEALLVQKLQKRTKTEDDEEDLAKTPSKKKKTDEDELEIHIPDLEPAVALRMKREMIENQ